MGKLESLIQETVGHDLEWFGTDTVRYFLDALNAAEPFTVYRTITGVVNPAEDQNLNEGNPSLQFTALILNISNRNATEGILVSETICHGDAANLHGGDRVKLSRDGYTDFWYVKRILSTAGGETQLLIVDNPGAIV